jgi:hypothetical protein
MWVGYAPSFIFGRAHGNLRRAQRFAEPLASWRANALGAPTSSSARGRVVCACFGANALGTRWSRPAGANLAECRRAALRWILREGGWTDRNVCPTFLAKCRRAAQCGTDILVCPRNAGGCCARLLRAQTGMSAPPWAGVLMRGQTGMSVLHSWRRGQSGSNPKIANKKN